MVIGLLIGGVLKGQELIENARITRMVKDIKDYDTAVMIFRNTYGALPGDIKQPNRIPNCTDYPCRNKSGTGSNSFKNGTSAIEIRRGNFWRHLGRAGLISGINDAEMDAKLTSPLTPFNGHIYINTISATFYSDGGPTKDHPDITRFFPRDTSLTVNMMYSCRRIGALDHKMDDGNPLQGDVRLFITRNYCVDKNDETRYTTNDDSSDHLLITVHSAQ